MKRPWVRLDFLSAARLASEKTQPELTQRADCEAASDRDGSVNDAGGVLGRPG
jgi:hypothetical protein